MTAVVVITHDLGVVAGMCRRILVMYAGRIVESGPAKPLLARPHHPYAVGLLKSVPRLDEPRQDLLQTISSLPPTSPACHPAARSRHAASRRPRSAGPPSRSNADDD